MQWIIYKYYFLDDDDRGDGGGVGSGSGTDGSEISTITEISATFLIQMWCLQ